MAKKLRIISLGDLVTQNHMEAINAFAKLINSKNPQISLKDAGAMVVQIVKDNLRIINELKIGNLTEKEFNAQMIEAIRSKTGVALTEEEFDGAWNAMNPRYDKYKAQLADAIAFNKAPNQELVIISYTNPKDIRYLIQNLKENRVPHKVSSDQILLEIEGIPVYSSYARRMPKADLVQQVVKDKSPAIIQGPVTRSISDVLGLTQQESIDIKFILAEKPPIADPALREDDAKTLAAVKAKLKTLGVDIVSWNKQEQSLAEVLEGNSQFVSFTQVATL